MAALSNKERVGRGFEVLSSGLQPFVDFHMGRSMGADWPEQVARQFGQSEYSVEDPAFQLRVMTDRWNDVFRNQLPRSARTLVFELRDTRNAWAHARQFKAQDAFRALDSMSLLLEHVDAQEVVAVRELQNEVGQELYERTSRAESERGSNVVDASPKGLKPWREVILPHPDVAEGRFNVAEFAADLEQVRKREGALEYSDPVRFFERTYLTAGLEDLLQGALQRVIGDGGQPVINCQTNFGGGKTHSLIALYHLFSGLSLDELPTEIHELVRESGVDAVPEVPRAVVVGNRFGAGESHSKQDGTEINTIWGEIAYQLGGTEGYAIVAEADRSRTNPGAKIGVLLRKYAPCIVLIDEWVAYARELYARDDLPGGTFDTQFGFAQALTEEVRATPNALFVVSIPASEQIDGSSDGPSDLEIGGAGGREALQRLTHVVARQAEHWQPATGDESFEIVRRRLFQAYDEDAARARDETAEAFGELYRGNRADFPSEVSDLRYVDRIKAAYPIHPELFDFLYREWSTVDRFQRTRGVLRLMASVIHSLWTSEDRSPLILPASVPLSDARVNSELTSKLDDHWRPVIDADIDGPESRAWRIDQQTPHLQRHHATRRVARSIFLGSAPTIRAANRGVEADHIRLASIFPGEPTGFVADALHRLSDQAPYLYVDRNRYWFDLQENVNRTARDEAERLLSGAKEDIYVEVNRRLYKKGDVGEFRGVHVAPKTGDDVQDIDEARLVILGPDSPHIAKAEASPALQLATQILDQRGSSPREYRNMLLFVAADQRRLEDLERSAADYLAWQGIVARDDELNLDTHQRKQAATKLAQADEAIDLRIAETYVWGLVPRLDDPVGQTSMDLVRINGSGSIAQRASRRFVNDGALQTQFPAVMLRNKLDNVLGRMWEDGHVSVNELWEAFAKYIYLPRLRDRTVLKRTIAEGPALTSWQSEGFGVAIDVDGKTGSYLGLAAGSHPGEMGPSAVIVKPEFALGQIETTVEPGDGGDEGGGGPTFEVESAVTRFSGSVKIDPERPNKAFSTITQEVLEHLTGLVDTDVSVELRVEALRSEGFPDDVIRTVTENARTLKFEEGSGFEEA